MTPFLTTKALNPHTDEEYWLGYLRITANHPESWHCDACRRIVVGSGKTFVCPHCRGFLFHWPGLVRAFLQLYGQPDDIFIYNLLGAPEYYWREDLSGARTE